MTVGIDDRYRRGRRRIGVVLLEIRHDMRSIRLGLTQPWTLVLMLGQLGAFGGVASIAGGRIRN